LSSMLQTQAQAPTKARSIGINSEGAMAGYYVNANNVSHGFVRVRDGAITEFDVPGAGTGQYEGTQAYDINRAGEVTGYYIDANGVYHGFLRFPDDLS